MANVLTALPQIENQHKFNRECWAKIVADEKLGQLEQKIETDRFGNVILMPHPGFDHSCLQGRIMELLRDLLRSKPGRVLPECPVSTSGEVKGIDVVWISDQRMQNAVDNNLLVEAPEICIEILSPGNTRDEITTKKQLYFEAGAEEVWLCSEQGLVSFYSKSDQDFSRDGSKLCPDFPEQVK